MRGAPQRENSSRPAAAADHSQWAEKADGLNRGTLRELAGGTARRCGAPAGRAPAIRRNSSHFANLPLPCQSPTPRAARSGSGSGGGGELLIEWKAGPGSSRRRERADRFRPRHTSSLSSSHAFSSTRRRKASSRLISASHISTHRELLDINPPMRAHSSCC